VRVGEREAGGRLEALERTALDPAAGEQMIELTQGVPRIVRLQIVLRPEQALAGGLPLAARDRAERVEPARDGAEEALLGLDVRRDRPEQRRLLLVGPVRAAEALDGCIRLPAGLEEIMRAQPRVPRGKLGVVAAPGAACVGEDQDALVVIHEGLRLC